jgi:hypothetical protein
LYSFGITTSSAIGCLKRISIQVLLFQSIHLGAYVPCSG